MRPCRTASDYYSSFVAAATVEISGRRDRFWFGRADASIKVFVYLAAHRIDL